jgi:hypothetical protein
MQPSVEYVQVAKKSVEYVLFMMYILLLFYISRATEEQGPIFWRHYLAAIDPVESRAVRRTGLLG